MCIKQPILLEPTFIKRLGKYLPDLPTFANLFCSDSINSSTFANLFCSASPKSPTFAKGHFWKKCDSPRHIPTSNLPFLQIWGEWPLLTSTPTATARSTKKSQLSQNNMVLIWPYLIENIWPFSAFGLLDFW